MRRVEPFTVVVGGSNPGSGSSVGNVKEKERTGELGRGSTDNVKLGK